MSRKKKLFVSLALLSAALGKGSMSLTNDLIRQHNPPALVQVVQQEQGTLDDVKKLIDVAKDKVLKEQDPREELSKARRLANNLLKDIQKKNFNNKDALGEILGVISQIDRIMVDVVAQRVQAKKSNVPGNKVPNGDTMNNEWKR